MKNYCVVCGGELREKTKLEEYGAVSTGEYYCIECGLRYEFIPPDHLQKDTWTWKKSGGNDWD